LGRAVRSEIQIAEASKRTASAWTQVRPLREEIASAAIQGSAAAASAVGLAYLVTKALPRQDALELGALTAYGASMFIAFLASALYHAVQHQRARSVLQRVDHCTIFLLIAGTYTPVALLPLRHHDGIALLASIWTLALAGIVVRLCNVPLFQRIAIGSINIALVVRVGRRREDVRRQPQRSSRTMTMPPSIRTGNVATGSYAGGESAAPVGIEKCAPWRGQMISSPATSPSDSVSAS
jgi:Haemolysin-III related